jgi:photosystem II stability/assembly factor-like uncharacterized protein
MRKTRLFSFCLLAAPLAASLLAQTSRDSAIANLKLREIGPAVMGGRVDAIAVVENNPKIVYVGLAGGGVWKTDNAFTTWEPVFDKEPVSSIGAIAVAPSDPSIVWAGTGEANDRQSTSWGNGVYRSLDAGKTWQHMGLDDTQQIGRIVINPHNPNIVYVAAQGHLWGPNHQRGVFKTTDGGKTWTPVLFISDNTGANDIAMDPESPDTLYATVYERQRTVAGYNGGGPESGLYKTIDGGANWTKLTDGIPHGDLGRIGVTIYRHNPNIVYALIESPQGGVFRSNDKGATWVRMGTTNPRPSYFTQIRIDPNNDQRVWIAGSSLGSSDDGGKTFRNSTLSTANGIYGSMHEDFHDWWIDPANSDHMYSGNDGGMYSTWDGGAHWTLHNNAPIGQFYGIAYDFKQPYDVCGGLQDNDSWCGPSNSLIIRGISNDEWLKVGGGDGMNSQIDPKDPNIIYSEGQEGSITRRDLRTQESRSIRPTEPEGAPPYRFQWTTPFSISNFDDKTLYIGGNFIFKSTDRGDSWTKISGDLTTGADRNKMPILGKLPSNDTLSINDGVTFFPEVTTLSESPARAGILWAGTDDGNLQVTRDDGKTWTNVVGNVPGVPKGTFVSRVVASKYAEGTAFVSFDGHRSNDFAPYLFMTTDFGAHWTDISNGLPRNTDTVQTIVEHFRNQNLLFAGTEMGLFVSFNRGKNWEQLKNNFPAVPVDDIKIQPRENDLILGTHGRSIWILDDITPLEQLSDQVLASDSHLFDVRPGVEWHMMDAKSAIGHAFYVAKNPPYGAIIDYYLKESAGSSASPKIEILDKDGKLVRTLTHLPGDAGVNRTAWDLRTDSPASGPQTGRRSAHGILVPPGEYTVRLSLGASQMTRKVLVEDDARVTLTPEDRELRTQTVTELFNLSKEANDAQQQFTALQTAIANLRESWKQPGAPAVPAAATKALDDLQAKMEAIEKTPKHDLPEGSSTDEYTPLPVAQRITQLMTTVDEYALRPANDQVAELKKLQAELPGVNVKIKQLIDEDLPAANKAIDAAGMPFLSIKTAPQRVTRVQAGPGIVLPPTGEQMTP